MTQEDKELLLAKIEHEDFDYCFDGYSSREDIEDEQFHKLRKAYLKAKKQLLDYINKCGND